MISLEPRNLASGQQFRQSRGFTLVELLVVIAIIGLLVALLMPAVQAAREAARRSQCLNNLKQLAIGLQQHTNSFRRFPIGAVNSTSDYSGLTYGSNRQTWIVTLLPFIEEQSVYGLYDQNLSGSSNTNWYRNANSSGPNSACAGAPGDVVSDRRR